MVEDPILRKGWKGDGVGKKERNRTEQNGSWFEFIVLTFYLPKIGFGHPRSIIKIIFKNNGKCVYFIGLLAFVA